MPKRINILTKHRIRKVIIELREIREDSKLNKVDSWNLEQATETIMQILEPDTVQAVPVVKGPKTYLEIRKNDRPGTTGGTLDEQVKTLNRC